MNERIKQLRDYFNLTQIEFAEKVHVSRSMLANLESGFRELKDIHVASICSAFNVSQHWFRTGEGEMFLSEVSDDVAELVKKRNLKPIDRAIIEAYISLPEEMRGVILSMAIRIANEAYKTDALPDGVSDNNIASAYEVADESTQRAACNVLGIPYVQPVYAVPSNMKEVQRLQNRIAEEMAKKKDPDRQ